MPEKTRWLECELTEDEIKEKGKALARAEEERSQNKEEKKAAVAEYDSTDKALGATISSLTKEINNKREWRNVEIEERADFETHLMEFYRKDTGERIGTRPLTVDELQDKFAFAKGAIEKFADSVDEGTTVTLSGAGKEVVVKGTKKKAAAEAGD